MKSELCSAPRSLVLYRVQPKTRTNRANGITNQRETTVVWDKNGLAMPLFGSSQAKQLFSRSEFLRAKAMLKIPPKTGLGSLMPTASN